MLVWDNYSELRSMYYKRGGQAYYANVDGDNRTVYTCDSDLDLLRECIKEYFQGTELDIEELTDNLVGDELHEEMVYTCDCCSSFKYNRNASNFDYFVGDGYITCGDCIRENPESYIEHLIDNYNTANQLLPLSELTDRGFIKLDENEVSFHYKTPAPKTLYEKYKDGMDIIFHIDSSNPFHTDYSVYGRKHSK